MMALDAVRSLGRISAAASETAFDRLRARAQGLPVSVDGVSPAWLSGALAARWPGVRVETVDVLDAHAGTTARARISVTYARGGESAPPKTLFLKVTPAARLQRLFLAATRIGQNEVRFYRDVRPTLPVRAPEVHGIASIAPGRQFVLVLEDLTHTGARLAAVGDRLEIEDARRIVRAMARLHAEYWESERFLGDLAWVPHFESRRRDMAWERFITGQMVALTRRRYAKRLGAPLARAAELVTRHRNRLEADWSMGPRTFVHGDAHLGNLFFERDRVGFLDWQVCARAPGMRDVSYLLCNSLSSALREAHEEALIRDYLGALEAHGIAAPDFDTAWRQHRSFALYTFIAAAFTAAAGDGLQSREIAEAGLRRATEAVTQLESVEHFA